MYRQKYQRFVIAAAIVAAAAAGPSRAHEGDEEGALDILEMGRHADFVFKGTVTAVAFRDSEPKPQLDANGAPVLDRDGEPVLLDGSNLAHTFVTYSIDEIFKGTAPAASITLRFLGGVQEDLVMGLDPSGAPIVTEEVFTVSEQPLFDVGDTDVLFVVGNTERQCPLQGCGTGRFRLIEHDPAAPGVRQVYSDLAEKILRVLETSGAGGPEIVQDVVVGVADDLPDVNVNTLGGSVLEMIEVKTGNIDDEGGDGVSDPSVSPGAQFTEDQFDDYLEATIEPAPPGTPAPASADIATPFFAKTIFDAKAPRAPREKVTKMKRPWLDAMPRPERKAILKAERLEKKSLKRSGGDPTLPEAVR